MVTAGYKQNAGHSAEDRPDRAWFDFCPGLVFCPAMSSQRIWATLDPFVEQGPVMGRTVANAGFLDGLFGLDPFEAYHFFPASQGACQSLAEVLSQAWPGLWAQGKIKIFTREALPRALEGQEYYVFHLSDCIMSPAYLACLRNAHAGKIFPITAVTHSLSYTRYAQEFLKHLQPGTTPRDALVATSRTAEQVVRNYYEVLRANYGLSREAFPQPRVARIPLGVDLRQFRPPDQGTKAQARRNLGYGSEVVFLILSRLSHSSKMDFLPVLRAFQRLFQDGLPRDGVRLVLAGWTDDDGWGRQTLSNLAANIGLELTVVSRPDEALKGSLYQAADVFLSPADNLQETFGLTLLEAQAMGLPVIASDFDGYRDLVEPEVTGFLTPTIGPAETEALDRLAPLFFDSQTHLLLSQRLAVDVPGLARAMADLIRNPEKRQEMGRAAVGHAREFSWPRIIESHLTLWEELWAAEVPGRPAAGLHPLAVPYARVFAGYPTVLLGPESLVKASRLGQAVYRGQDFPIVHAGLEAVLDTGVLRALLVLGRRPVTVGELCAKLAQTRGGLSQEDAQAHILWSLKHDLLERLDDSA